MKPFLKTLIVAGLSLAVLVPNADAKRLGGGASIGKQRSSPAMNEAPRSTPNATPSPTQGASSNATAKSTPTQAAPAPAAAAAPKPSFMNRWGGMIAGIGMGALLGSLLGGHLGGLGSALGGVLNILLIAGVLYMAYRFFMSRRSPAAGGPQFAGAGGGFASPNFRNEPIMPAPSPATVGAVGGDLVGTTAIPVPPGFEIEPFIRQSQSSFLRMQAANDAGDLDDLRETTTPEVFAELAMQIRERGDLPQKTDIVSLDARLLEVVVEGNQMIASLRYSGTAREAIGAAPTPFDEVWHLRRAVAPANGPWLIAGIQQMA